MPRAWLSLAAGQWQDSSTGLPALGGCRYTELEDMDGDGRLDLVTFGSREVHVFSRAAPADPWSEISAFTVPDSPGRARAFRVGGDVDHNGRADIVLVSNRQVDLFNTRNQVHVYRESTPPASLAVRLVHPKPRRRLLAGSTRFIRWATEVPPGDEAMIDIDLSTSGAAGPWMRLAQDLPDNGRWQWTVPARVSEQAYLRVTAHTVGGQASTIGAGPLVIARRPDPLELLLTDLQTVSWTDTLTRDRHHLYRGDWQRFLATGEYTQDPVAVPGAERWCGLEVDSVRDAFTPQPGRLAFYLSTGSRLVEDGQEPGVPVEMAEGTLGQDSAARMRPHDHRCGGA